MGAERRRPATSCAAGSRRNPGCGWARRAMTLASVPTLTLDGPRGPAHRAACLRRGPPGLVRGDARRPDPGGGAGGRHVAAERGPAYPIRPGPSARTPGCWRPSRRNCRGSGWCPGRPGAGRRPGGVDVVPGGREPVLDGPLCRAGRSHGPPGASRARPAQRLRRRGQPRRHGMPAGAARRPHPGERHLSRASSGTGAGERLLAAPGAELFALVVDDKRPGTLAHAVTAPAGRRPGRARPTVGTTPGWR